MTDFASGEERVYPGRMSSAEISSINLSTRGGSWELYDENALISLIIYEDIFLNYMTGNITVIDHGGLFEDAPICGDETLTVTFKTAPEYPRANFTKQFWIYKCEEFTTTHGSRGRVYQLNFAGKASHKNFERRLRRSFKGMKEDVIVQNICTNLLEVEVEVEACKYPRDIVFPGYRPLFAINYLATSCVRGSGYPSSNYLFFESMDKYHFVSMDKLVDKSYDWEIDFHMARHNSPRSDAKLWNAKEWKIVRAFDNISNASGGMWAHKFYAQDILRKKVEEKTYTYSGEFNSHPHADSGGVKLRENHSSELDQCVSFGPWQKDGGGTEYNSKHADDWMKRRKPMIQDWMNWGLELVTEGNSAARLGDKVKFNLVSNKSGSEEEDKRLSGEYLITRMKHMITKTEHTMVVEIRKDCFRS